LLCKKKIAPKTHHKYQNLH